MSSGGKGNSMRDQLKSAWRQTGVKPKALEELVEMPSSCFHVWKMFIDLNNARGSNGFGVNPISYTEIYSYCKLHTIDIDEWELDLIKEFDKTVLDIYAEQQEQKAAAAKSK